MRRTASRLRLAHSLLPACLAGAPASRRRFNGWWRANGSRNLAREVAGVRNNRVALSTPGLIVNHDSICATSLRESLFLVRSRLATAEGPTSPGRGPSAPWLRLQAVE
jgi:hypothetical protein